MYDTSKCIGGAKELQSAEPRQPNRALSIGAVYDWMMARWVSRPTAPLSHLKVI
jgi:hypothetical protein